jgi:hypothetical protein
MLMILIYSLTHIILYRGGRNATRRSHSLQLSNRISHRILNFRTDIPQIVHYIIKIGTPTLFDQDGLITRLRSNLLYRKCIISFIKIIITYKD